MSEQKRSLWDGETRDETRAMRKVPSPGLGNWLQGMELGWWGGTKSWRKAGTPASIKNYAAFPPTHIRISTTPFDNYHQCVPDEKQRHDMSLAFLHFYLLLPRRFAWNNDRSDLGSDLESDQEKKKASERGSGKRCYTTKPKTAGCFQRLQKQHFTRGNSKVTVAHVDQMSSACPVISIAPSSA